MSSEEVSVCDEAEPCVRRVIPFCGIAPDLEDSTDSTDAPAGAGSAVVVKTKIWSGRQALKVFFMSEVPAGWTFDGQPLTTDVIIDWANIWSENGKYDKVPIFKETSIRNKGDIRVDFSKNDGCWSRVGMYAERVRVSDPTMVLNLCDKFCTQGADQKSLVIHEFGHALGLEHEHQRSDFWKVMEKHLNFDAMSDDSRVSKDGSGKEMATFGKDWFKKKYGVVNGIKKFLGVAKRRVAETEYDPDSIMHYGFDVDWLKDPRLRNRHKINDCGLAPEEVKYIKGIHERNKSLAAKPSKLDRSALQEAYGEVAS